MIKINLSSPNESEIKYDKIKYPDGQVSIRFFGDLPNGPATNYCFEIRSRMNSYEDLMYILAAKDALSRIYPWSESYLYVSCFLGQRSDRRFSNYESFDLKIVTDIINAAGFSKVKVLHPHSDVLPALLNNCFVIDNTALVDYAISMFHNSATPNPNLVLVSPDAGAYKQVVKHANKHDLTLIAANKCRIDRDNLEIILSGNVNNRICLIIDDYIDGGRTFATLARMLKDRGAASVYLAVTHGLFSKGFDIPDVDLVFTTNSIQDIDHPKVKQIRVI